MSIYLYVNSVLYFLLALWCILLPEKTALAVGYQLIGGSGRSEYLVVYGGLQLGLAVFFTLCAWKTEWNFIGILFASCLYLPIFVCRAWSLVKFEGIGSVTLYTACLEAVLTVWAAYLFLSRS